MPWIRPDPNPLTLQVLMPWIRPDPHPLTLQVLMPWIRPDPHPLTLQVLMPWIRPDPNPLTLLRRSWEFIHGGLGRAIVAMGLVNIASGVAIICEVSGSRRH